MNRAGRRLVRASVLAALVTGVASVDSAPAATAQTPPVRYLDATFEVDVQRDVVYGSAPAPDGSGATVQLQLDLYTPRGDVATDRPVFIYAHGGFFIFGSRTDNEPTGWATRMAQRGYVTASISYRLGPNLVSAPIDTQEEIDQIDRARLDMQAAVRWFRAHAASLRIDPDRIAVGGSSAGAVTALGVAINSDTADSVPPVASNNGEFSSAVCTAVANMGANSAAAVGPGDAGAIFHHGVDDGIVPYALAVETRDAMVAAGLPVQWHEYPGRGHNVPTGSDPARARTIQWLYERVATAPYPCSPAVAKRVAVPSGQQTVITGAPGRSGVVSLFAVDSTGPGYIQVLPCGTAPGATANLNTDAAGQTRSTVAIVRFDAAGRACIYNQSRVHLVADLQGYFAEGAFDDVADVRLIDTRTGPRPASGAQTVINGRPDSTGVVSLVATETGGAGYVQVLPCGATPGATANLNADRVGQTRAGLAFVRFDSSGRACVYNQTATHLVVDLQGYMTPGSFDDQPDRRLFDTRSRAKPAAGEMAVVTGPPSSTMVMTLSATESAGAGFLQVLPSCDDKPGGSANLYVDRPGQIVSALSLVKIPGTGFTCTYTNVATHIVGDVQGFMADGAFDDIVDQRLLDTRIR